jgi:hypothetical protein
MIQAANLTSEAGVKQSRPCSLQHDMLNTARTMVEIIARWYENIAGLNKEMENADRELKESRKVINSELVPVADSTRRAISVIKPVFHNPKRVKP